MPAASHSTGVPSPLQAVPRCWIVEPNIDYRTFLGTCPSAQTLLADNPSTCVRWVIPLLCKQWSCRFCAAWKCRKLAARTRDAKPSRMLTLTVDPSKWSDPRAAFDGTRRHLPTLIKTLRQRFGSIEYLRVTELTHNGWPHYHLLIRSGYLPQAVIRNEWQRLTGARIVDIRPVDKRWSAYTYLLKYLCKLSNLGWTERHVSTSHGFFPPEPERPPSRLQIERAENLPMHPATYLARHASGQYIVRLSPSIFAVSDSLDSLQGVCDEYDPRPA